MSVKVMTCGVHGECTVAKKVEGAACCKKCPQYQPAEAPVLTDPFTGPPIRDLAYHLFPLKGNGTWQWNVRQLLQRIKLFNGRRRVAVAYSASRTDSPADVLAAFRGEIDRSDLIVIKNEPSLREVASFDPLFSAMETTDPNRCLLYAHGKGVRHDPEVSVVRLWAQTLYETMMDYWPVVEEQLQQHPLTGPFREKRMAWPEHSKAEWFYSGSWVWYRSKHLFSKPNWREIERFWTGIEPYPAIMFPYEESGCLVHDPQGNLYDATRWRKTILPRLEVFRQRNAGRRMVAQPRKGLHIVTHFAMGERDLARTTLRSFDQLMMDDLWAVGVGFDPRLLTREFPWVNMRACAAKPGREWSDALKDISGEDTVVGVRVGCLAQRSYTQSEDMAMRDLEGGVRQDPAGRVMIGRWQDFQARRFSSEPAPDFLHESSGHKDPLFRG